VAAGHISKQTLGQKRFTASTHLENIDRNDQTLLSIIRHYYLLNADINAQLIALVRAKNHILTLL
jgi:hypothetical protein